MPGEYMDVRTARPDEEQRWKLADVLAWRARVSQKRRE
jgi:hypothetical protein